MHYRLRERRRQELFEARVRATTLEHLERHERALRQFEAEDLLQYVPEEARRVTELLARARRLLASDPAAARDASVEAGRHLYGLPAQARGAFRAAKEAELRAEATRHEREQQLREELEQRWRTELSQWEDALVRRLAAPALAKLRRTLLQQADTGSIQALAAGMARVRRDSEAQAQAVREASRKEAEAETRRVLLAQIAPTGAEEQGDLASASTETLARHAGEALQRADEAALAEEARREVVRSVYAALGEAGFVVESPRHIVTDGSDEVLIRATRPAGAEASFRVRLGGDIEYEFDGYEGAACRQDIEQVVPTLQSVYGISLSDHRVIWENPDDRDQDARPWPEAARRSGHE